MAGAPVHKTGLAIIIRGTSNVTRNRCAHRMPLPSEGGGYNEAQRMTTFSNLVHGGLPECRLVRLMAAQQHLDSRLLSLVVSEMYKAGGPLPNAASKRAKHAVRQ